MDVSVVFLLVGIFMMGVGQLILTLGIAARVDTIREACIGLLDEWLESRNKVERKESGDDNQI